MGYSSSNTLIFPSNERALTEQYEKRVSVSPKESPANTPDGCWRESMTVRGESVNEMGLERLLTFNDTIDIDAR